MFSIKKTYQMNIEDANATLQTVFAACNQTPNTVPFDKILLQQATQTKSFDVSLKIIIVLLCLTLLSPLAFLQFRQSASVSPIVLKEQYIEDTKIYLNMDFGSHIIQFEEAYLVSPGGTIYEIVSYDMQTQTLCFPYVAPNCTIHIPYDDEQVFLLQLDF